MRRCLQLAVALLVLVGLCAPAEAQRRMRRQAAPIVIGPAGTQVVPANQLGTLSPASSALLNTSGSDVSSLINGFPAPGLGFDFTHFAAVNRNLGVRALIDPVTQHQLALARQIRRETPVAVPIAFPTVVNNIIIINQPPVVIIPQTQPVDEPDERYERVRYVEREPAPVPVQAAPVAPEPVVELGEIVLIRMDGSVVFAVGFSNVNGHLVYVTREGFRRSFPMSHLDVDATRRMNEERGTALRLPS